MSIGTRLREALQTTPKKYQIQAVRFLEENEGRGILGDDMGLGKTLEAIGWISIHPEKSPVVVICPAAVKYQWQRQLQEHAGLDSEVLEGSKPYPPTKKIVIINYDILSSDSLWPNGRREKGARPIFPWVETLRGMAPQVVILDELHYIKNRSALRTRACVQLCRKIRHVIAASGTPIEKCPVEFFPVLNLIDPLQFGSFMKYAFRYCNPQMGFRGHWNFQGADNLEELHQVVSTWMIRRMKIDVATELPPKIRTVLPVDISNRKIYNRAETDFLKWLEERHGEEAALRAAGAVGLTRLGQLKQIAAQGKLSALQSWIGDFLEESGDDDKLVVFCVHRKILAALRKFFPKSVSLLGGTPTGKRMEILKQFQTDPKCRVFFGQLRAAGVGLDGLHKAASNVLFAELGWNFSEHEQAEDRCLRIGQDATAVNVYYLIGRGTVEEDILEMIQGKHDVCNQVLNGSIMDLKLFKRRRK